MDFQQYITDSQSEEKPARKKQNLWDLLSTMKFAIWILILLGALSLVSMFVGELRDPNTPKGQGFGEALMNVLQMDDPFRSWWYRLLLALLCLSLFACILERLPIIWRLWTKKPPQDAEWLKSVRHGIVRTTGASRDALAKRFSGIWTWRVKNDKLWVGEHGRVSMWGPLFTHVGLLLIGLGALVGSFGGLHEKAGGYSGELVQLPGMNFSVRIDSFRIEYYPLQPGQWVQVDNSWVGKLEKKQPDGKWLVQEASRMNESGETEIVEAARIRNAFDNQMDRSNIKRYCSYVTVLENGQEKNKAQIAVNSPLRKDGYRFYQSSYDVEHPKTTTTYDAVKLFISDSAAGKSDTLVLKAGIEIPVPGDTLMIMAGELLPHFKLGQQGAYSESAEFINPAVKLHFRGPKGFEKTQWVFLKFPAHEAGPGKWTYRLSGFSGEHSLKDMLTIWDVKKTHGDAILWAGFFFATIGLLLSFYISHRVLYVEWPSDNQQLIKLTGLTRKTSHLYARQIDHLLEGL
jgi:cytochrome c biogenesis protein